MTNNPNQHPRRGPRALRTIGAALCAAALAGAAFQAAPMPGTSTPSFPQTQEHGRLGGSLLADFDVNIETRAIRGGQAEVDVVLFNRFGRRSAFKVAHHFVDARGRSIRNPLVEAAQVAADGDQTVLTLRTPSKVDDGFYMMRVLAAGTDGERDTVIETERYFRVAAGDITPIGVDEWLSNPEVGTAHDD